MSSYIGRHALLYDLFYAEKPYRTEAIQLHKWLTEFGNGQIKKILELACGTGTNALLLAALGYEIVASDYSKDMVEQARTKSKTDNPLFKVEDMLTLDETKTYDAVLCLFDSIGYVQTNEAILKVLGNIHKALKPEGVFIFEFWHAAAMIRSYDPLRIKYFQTDSHTIQRTSETSIDFAKQVCSVKYTIHEFDKKNKTYAKLEETQKNRFFLLQEMKLFLEENNFELIKAFDGYSDKELIDETSWHILAVCKKK